MGRGNVCVFGKYEGLFYIDNDYLHEYKKAGDESDDPEIRLLRELNYDDISSGEWVFDDFWTAENYMNAIANFRFAFQTRFDSFSKCDLVLEHDRQAILENNLFYIAVADNQWSHAVMLIQKDHWCYDYSGLQKRHYKQYLDGMRDCLFEQFETLGTYAGAWTSGRISRADFVRS